jgi:hypothetical protein
MSAFSQLLRKTFGIPEVNLRRHPLLSALVAPLLDGFTKDAAAKAVDALPTPELETLTRAGIAELRQRGINL